MGGGSGLSRSSEAGVSREDWPGEEGAGGKRRAAPGADESVAAAFRLRLASAAWAWVTCAQPPACPPGCASGARRIGARSLLSVPKLAFSYFLTSTLLRPCPALSCTMLSVSGGSLPPGQPMPLPAPERLSLHSGCAPRAPSNLDPSLHPGIGGC